MNIFILDYEIKKCAEFHVDRHYKMILETAQMLSTVLRSTGTNYGYKEFNKSHPCNIWASSSLSNFNWLRELGIYLTEEMTYRYGTVHKSFEIIRDAPNPSIPDIGLTPFAQAMPEEFKDKDPVKAYRNFYRIDKFKKGLIKYTNRKPPEWLNMKFDVNVIKDKTIYVAKEYL